MRVLVLLLVALVAGCADSGSGGGSDDSSTLETVRLEGSDSSHTVDRSDRYNLELWGDRMTVDVAEDQAVESLEIWGSADQVVIGAGSLVSECAFWGDDSTIEVPEGMGFSCDDHGSGNQVVRY